MQKTRETRFLPATRCSLQLAKRAEGEGRTLEGYGAVFYDGTPETEYPLWSDVVERIMPGAFQRTLSENIDVRGLFNHDPSLILGRVSAGTCRLSIDGKGLRYEIDLPDTQLARDLGLSIERRDVTGSSFSFIPERVMWVHGEDGVDVREIHSAIVFDVGPVTWPAYEATTASIRGQGDLSELRREWQAWREAAPSEADEVEIRLRLLDLDQAG